MTAVTELVEGDDGNEKFESNKSTNQQKKTCINYSRDFVTF